MLCKFYLVYDAQKRNILFINFNFILFYHNSIS